MTPADDGHHVYRREIDPQVRTSLSVLAALVAPGSRVLDLGTGSGALGRHLREASGCSVDGVTLSADEQAAARPWYDRIEVLDLEHPSWPQRFADRRYDVIVCADVLEHLREPERVLQACRTLLRPDGWLLVSIPNVAYAGMTVALMHGDWTYGPEGLLDRTHLRFYTRRSFTRLLEAEGWRVERVEPIDHSWYYTEFWTPFDQLPPAVARYLLAQPDASAYQLVFAARPAAAAPDKLAAAVPAPDPTVSVAVYTATLYAGGADLSRSVNVLGRVGAEVQSLVFAIPPAWSPGDGLRFDPADRPGFMHLHAMTLRDASGQPRWQWRADVDGAEPLQACRRHGIEFGVAPPQAPFLTLALLDDDPQIHLPLPPALQAGDGPWRLEVSCGWPLSADYLAVQALLRPVTAAVPAPAAQTEPTAPLAATGGWLQRLRQALRSPQPSATNAP
ncbi:MAG TPA: class I SAM-dependent methyltransferase, partial [Rubrivivax sp.]|nr:class I SAM-dependent methyltransferase [Rubrivivax sp.]